MEVREYRREGEGVHEGVDESKGAKEYTRARVQEGGRNAG